MTDYEPLAVDGDMRLGDLAEILRLLRERNGADRVALVGELNADTMGHVTLLETLRALLEKRPDVGLPDDDGLCPCETCRAFRAEHG